MRNYSKFIILLATVCIGSMQLSAEQMDPKKITLTAKAKEQLAGKQILYIEREQYAPDHHNTATLFQKEEINESSFFPGGAMRIFDVNTGNTTTLIELKDGLVRDPELSFDGKKIIFSMRKNKDDFYHIYEINTDGSELKQLTFAAGVSDICRTEESCSVPPASPNIACATGISCATCTGWKQMVPISLKSALARYSKGIPLY